jgi:hypothetical protein
MDPDPLTVEEFERVMRSERFATIHDLTRADGLRALEDGAQATEHPANAPDDETATRALPTLPARRA